MNARRRNTINVLPCAAAIAVALIVYGGARFPGSLADGGAAYFGASLAALAIYGVAGFCALNAPLKVKETLAIGSMAGLCVAAVGVANHTIEIAVAVAPSAGAVLGASMWGLMFLTYAIAGSVAFGMQRSIALGILSSIWSGMVFAAILVASALVMDFVWMHHMQEILASVYDQGGTLASESFVVRHDLGAAGEHLLLAPLIAAIVGLISGGACLLLRSMKRQTAIILSGVAVVVFGAAIASIRHASSLERAQRPPFIMFGLSAFAGTLAACPALFVAIRHDVDNEDGA